MMYWYQQRIYRWYTEFYSFCDKNIGKDIAKSLQRSWQQRGREGSRPRRVPATFGKSFNSSWCRSIFGAQNSNSLSFSKLILSLTLDDSGFSWDVKNQFQSISHFVLWTPTPRHLAARNVNAAAVMEVFHCSRRPTFPAKWAWEKINRRRLSKSSLSEEKLRFWGHYEAKIRNSWILPACTCED